MKVEMIKTLKVTSEIIVLKGTIISDPIPAYVLNEIAANSGVVRIIEKSSPVPAGEESLGVEKEPVAIASPPVETEPPSAPLIPKKRKTKRLPR